MKIDILSDRRDGQGGMESVFTLLSKELELRGCDVRVVLTEPSTKIAWESTLSGRVEHITEDQEWVDTSNYQRYLRNRGIEVELFYKTTKKPDVVIVATRGFEVPVRNALGKNVLILSWPHVNLNLYLHLADDAGHITKAADGFLAISDSIRKQSERKDPLLPTFSIGNPVNLDVLSIPRPIDVPSFVYIGRITEQKRVDWIIRAFADLNRKSWKLKIIGDGDLECQISQLAKQLSVYDRIEWLPFQENPWEQVKQASVVLLSSWFEGFPVVILEALARGVPVIATDCPTGPSDIIKDGENGYLVGVEDYDAFVDTILDIIDGNLELPEPDICRASVEMYETAVVVDRLLSAIRTLQQQGEVLVK